MRKIVISLLMFSGIAFALDNNAKEIYNQIKSKYGSKSGINQNINKPATGTADFTTLDSSSSFSAPLECPSADKAVVISFSSAGGDWIANISVDTDFDGNPDYNYTTPNISGICTNGIVSCTPGTWNNCTYYYWDAPNKKPKLIATNDTSLTGTCSCVNVSCGITQIDKPLFAHIGGGVAQAIMKADDRFLISKSKWNENILEMYGQDRKNCKSPSFNNYGETNPTQYYKSQTEPNVSIADVAAEQGNDPYSPYSVVSDIPDLEYKEGKKISMPEIQSCTIRNIVYAETKTFYEDCNNQFTDNNGQKWCIVHSIGDIPSCRRNRDGSILEQELNGDVELKYNQKWGVYMKISYLGGDRGRYWIRKIKNDEDWIEDSKYTKEVVGCVDILKVIGIAEKKGERHSLYVYQKAHSWGKNHTYPPKYGLIYIMKSIDYQDDEFGVTEQNNCPSNCTLLNEWVCDKDGNNCIQTVKDGNPLLVDIKKQCYEYSTSISKYIICSDGNSITVQDYYGTKVIGSGWFYTKREYNCGAQNLDVDLSRSKHVIEHTDLSGSQITYTDVDGSSGSFDLSKVQSDSCPNPVCTVQLPAKDTSVFADDTNRSQTPAGSDTNELEVRVCNKDDNGNMTCPLNSGETLIEDCKCDVADQRVGFERAITSLQVLNEAAKDMICSSSPP